MKSNVCVCVCVCVSLAVSLFLIHGHSFKLIWTKFGLWHPYTLRMVVGRLASAARAYRLALLPPSVRRCKSLPIVQIL